MAMAEELDLSPERVAKDNKEWNENHLGKGHRYHVETRTDKSFIYNHITCDCDATFIVLCLER